MRFNTLVLVFISSILFSCGTGSNNENTYEIKYDTIRFGSYYGTKFSDIVQFRILGFDGQPLTSLYDGSQYIAKVDIGSLENFRPRLISSNHNVTVKELSLNKFELTVNKKIDGKQNYDAHFALLNTYDTSRYKMIRRDSASSEVGYTEIEPFADLDTIVRFMMKIKPEKLACSYENKTQTLGIGLITLASDSFAIYNDANLEQLFWADNVYHFGNQNEKCCARFHKPDYGILNFICINEDANSYEILTNDSNKYMAKNDLVSFKSWEDYIKGSMGIRRSIHDVSISPEENPFRIEPNDDADIIEIEDDFESVCGVKLAGEWLKVRLDCSTFCEETNCEKSIEAWIRWRKGEELLIDIALLS